MSSNDGFVIEDGRVTLLAPKIAADRADAIFTFLIQLLEAQGVDIKGDTSAMGEALPMLQSDLDEYVTSNVYTELQMVNPVAAQEFESMIDQGISYEDGYDFFAQKLSSFETALAKAFIAFARQKLTTAQFYIWNTFLYRFEYLHYQWMVIPDFINDLLQEQKASVVTAENRDSLQNALYQQFYQQFYAHYLPTIGSPWREEFVEKDEKGEFPSYQSVFQYFTQWSKTLKTDLVPFLVAFRDEYLRRDEEAAAAMAQTEKADEERNNLAGRIQRDREKAFYTFSMSTLMTMPLATDDARNNRETQEKIYQDANLAVIFHLASCLTSTEEKKPRMANLS
jgi:hypothetical protein